ncbi:hypothetical protein FBEOM_6135 [Fusarium beomiforme]|uniref:Uncharacterized protein n=1 Tax=Fusarium beomiforme TaxID=44412 RepID=A0A9P5DWK5_9HYPO|nr:hypothetical protein FBEOM_6135 [Fusarium beomiforme]
MGALSEAPLIEWFPLEMAFACNAIRAVVSGNSLLRTLAATDATHHSDHAIIDNAPHYPPSSFKGICKVKIQLYYTKRFPYHHSIHADGQVKYPTRYIQIELSGQSDENVWIGSGTLHYDSQSLLSVDDLAAPGPGDNGMLEVELRTVSQRSFETRHDWELRERSNYATTLGFAFGVELAKLG